MKIFLKFDHSQETFYKALCAEKTEDEAQKDIFKVLKEYLENEEIKKSSHLAELVHNTLDYEVILFMATEFMTSKLIPVAAVSMAIDKLKEMLDDDED